MNLQAFFGSFVLDGLTIKPKTNPIGRLSLDTSHFAAQLPLATRRALNCALFHALESF